jgi:hypothetical protein
MPNDRVANQEYEWERKIGSEGAITRPARSERDEEIAGDTSRSDDKNADTKILELRAG